MRNGYLTNDNGYSETYVETSNERPHTHTHSSICLYLITGLSFKNKQFLSGCIFFSNRFNVSLRSAFSSNDAFSFILLKSYLSLLFWTDFLPQFFKPHLSLIQTWNTLSSPSPLCCHWREQNNGNENNHHRYIQKACSLRPRLITASHEGSNFHIRVLYLISSKGTVVAF